AAMLLFFVIIVGPTMAILTGFFDNIAGIRFLMSHTLLGVTEFNGSFSGKQKGMRDASLCYFCLIKSEIKL
ncbi:hypothetical protein, partial [Vibrio parahaemolyticus]|uniref:hypothetical protein n=1 Tax=Vibrio parahaemolyticus TaxID=670 RepID=UPI0032AFD7A8